MGAVLDLHVGQVVRGAHGLYVRLGDDEGREVEGKVVEAAPHGRFPRRAQAPAEALVVALAPFEAPVDEEAKPPWFRRRADL